MQENTLGVQQPHKRIDSKETRLKRVKRWSEELGKEFGDLANTKRGRALYAALFTELDITPIYAALRRGENAIQNGGPIQPLVNAGMSAGKGTTNAIQSVFNSISPNAGTQSVSALHNFIQWLGGPIQTSTYITMTLAVTADYAAYFFGITAFVLGIRKYFQKRNQDNHAQRTALA